MICAPFRVVRSDKSPLFPTVKTCTAFRDHETHPECCCRAYPNRGFYVVGACEHAHGWDLKREDAEAQCARLNGGPAESAAADGEGREVPAPAVPATEPGANP